MILLRRAVAFAIFAAVLIGAPLVAAAAPPPPVPPIADANRYQSYNLNSPTSSVQVNFPVFGDCTDILVRLNGVPLVLNTDFTCASTSGGSDLALLPLPITDLVVTFSSTPTTNLPTVPPSSGFLEIIGAWHARDLVQPTAPGINRREFNQTVSTLIAAQRELYPLEQSFAAVPQFALLVGNGGNGALLGVPAPSVAGLCLESTGPTSLPAYGSCLGNSGVTGPGSAVPGDVPYFVTGAGSVLGDSGLSYTSIVTGPTSAVSANLASFADTTGKHLADSGISAASVKVLSSGAFNVKAYGALGNSNGTHGNGNDDTSAIQAAATASGNGQLYFPCGTYRISSAISFTNYNDTYYVYGAPGCVYVFLDNSASAAALNFNYATPFEGVAPAVVIENIHFMTPNSPAGTIAVEMNQVQSMPIFRTNTFDGYAEGVSLVKTYFPLFFHNDFINLLAIGIACNVDVSCNGAQILANAFYTNGASGSAPAISIGPGSGATSCLTAANGIAISNNDFEANYGAIALNGACAVDIRANYIAGNTHFAVYLQSGYNSALSFWSNWFNANGPSNTVTFAAVTANVVYWGLNVWAVQTMNFGDAPTYNTWVKQECETSTLPSGAC